MRILILLALLSGCCFAETRASDPAEIECEILNAWEFRRCENSEVICYATDDGLACKWK